MLNMISFLQFGTNFPKVLTHNGDVSGSLKLHLFKLITKRNIWRKP